MTVTFPKLSHSPSTFLSVHTKNFCYIPTLQVSHSITKQKKLQLEKIISIHSTLSLEMQFSKKQVMRVPKCSLPLTTVTVEGEKSQVLVSPVQSIIVQVGASPLPIPRHWWPKAQTTGTFPLSLPALTTKAIISCLMV